MAGKRPNTIHGYDLGEVVSALQKSIRRGDEEAALYWMAEMDRSNFGEYCWKRLKIITSEDVGLAWPEGPAVIRALYENWSDMKKNRKAGWDELQGSARLYLTHAVILLSQSKKSRTVDHAVAVAFTDHKERREIPDVALDSHTYRGKSMGRGYQFFVDVSSHLENVDESIADPYRDRWAAILLKQVNKIDLPITPREEIEATTDFEAVGESLDREHDEDEYGNRSARWGHGSGGSLKEMAQTQRESLFDLDDEQ